MQFIIVFLCQTGIDYFPFLPLGSVRGVTLSNTFFDVSRVNIDRGLLFGGDTYTQAFVSKLICILYC